MFSEGVNAPGDHKCSVVANQRYKGCLGWLVEAA